MSEFILAHAEKTNPPVEFGTSDAGWPTFSSGKPITTEEVKALIEAMEEEEDLDCR